MSKFEEFKLFSGSANPELARAISDELARKLPNKPDAASLGAIRLRRFSDGECFCQIEENVRGEDVYVVQSTCPPTNSHWGSSVVKLQLYSAARGLPVKKGSINTVAPPPLTLKQACP